MAKQQKTLLDEETLKAAKELDEAAAAITEEIGEVEIKEPNGTDFEKLMAKDVVLREEIQNVLTRDGGKCDNLTKDHQAEYKKYLCAKIGVSPTLQPIDLIPTKNGLRPYLNKGASELIRDTRKISITGLEVAEQNGMFVVTCKVRGVNGRIDCDMGACPKGKEPNNDLMKAVTKSKRRATLSMCGLGAIIEEAHPTEYNGNGTDEQPKSSILLEEQEDEKEVKTLFVDVVMSKFDVEVIPTGMLTRLLVQAQHLANTKSIGEAARWLQEHGEISLTKDDEGKVVKATIKEVKNGKEG